MKKTTSQLQIVSSRGVDALGNIITTRITPPQNINVFRVQIFTDALAANPAGLSNTDFKVIQQAFPLKTNLPPITFDRTYIGAMADEFFVGCSVANTATYFYWEGEIANFV